MLPVSHGSNVDVLRSCGRSRGNGRPEQVRETLVWVSIVLFRPSVGWYRMFGYVRDAVWTGNGVLDRFLEDESLFGEFLRTPVSEGGVESLVVEPPHIVVEVGA